VLFRGDIDQVFNAVAITIQCMLASFVIQMALYALCSKKMQGSSDSHNLSAQIALSVVSGV
jgi:L-serine dehydratase